MKYRSNKYYIHRSVMNNTTKLLYTLVLAATLFTTINAFSAIKTCKDLIHSHESYSSTAADGIQLYFNNTNPNLPNKTFFQVKNSSDSKYYSVVIRASCTGDKDITFSNPQVLINGEPYPLSGTGKGVFITETIYTSATFTFTGSAPTGQKPFSFTIPITTFS
jgi:hypothetical protein